MFLHLRLARCCDQAPDAEAEAALAPAPPSAAQSRVLRPRMKAESEEEKEERQGHCRRSPGALGDASHREPSSGGGGGSGSLSDGGAEEGEEDSEEDAGEEEGSGRIDCVCGVTDADPSAEDHAGLWVQCDACGAWLHGACIGFPRRGPPGAYPPQSAELMSQGLGLG